MILLEKANGNFEVAEKLAKVAEELNKTEYYDIAVSRLYYSSYQRVVSYINNMPSGNEHLKIFKNNSSDKNKGSHDLTITFLENSLKFSSRDTSKISLLKALKEARRIADYEKKRACSTKKKYERYKKNAEIINSFIDSL